MPSYRKIACEDAVKENAAAVNPPPADDEEDTDLRGVETTCSSDVNAVGNDVIDNNHSAEECMQVDQAREVISTKPSSPEPIVGGNLNESCEPDVADPNTKQSKTSRFTGVFYDKRANPYHSNINVEGKHYGLGGYHVQADAALAYDECCEVLWRRFGEKINGRFQRVNFRTHQDYIEARSQELQEVEDDIKEANSADKVYEKTQDRIDAVSKRTSTSAVDSESAPADNSTNNSSCGQANRYRGVSYVKENAKYRARIGNHGKYFYMGLYELQADAAHAYDRGLKELHISRNPNFKTTEEYQQAREQELIQCQFSVNMDCIDKQISERIGVLQQKNDDVQTVAAASKHIQIEKKPRDHSGEESEGIITNDTTDDNRKTRIIVVSATGGNMKESHEPDEADHNTKQSKTSRFTGVSYNKRDKCYDSRISIDGKQYPLGTYHNQADAAMAYDEYCKVLGGRRLQRVNFSSHQNYIEARSQELQEVGDGMKEADSADKVYEKIRHRIDAISSKLSSTTAVDSKSVAIDNTTTSTHHNSKLGSTPELHSTKRGNESTSAPTTVIGDVKKKRKRQHKSKRRGDRKLNTMLELNEMTHMLTKKWGALFDQNSSIADCMESHQKDITAILTNMSRSVHQEDLMVIESDSSLHSDHPNAADEVASNSSKLSIDASAMSPTAIEGANITVSSPIDKEVEKESGFEETIDYDECAQSTTCCVTEGKHDAGEDPQAIVENSTEQVMTSNGCAQSVRSDEDDSIDALFDDEDSIENMVEEKDVDPKTNIDDPTEDIGHDATCTININPSELMTLNPDQMETLPFPIGCHVWSNLTTVTGGATFRSGTVVCASFNFMTRQLYYKVMLDDGNTVVWLDELAFGPTCPIYYSPTNMTDNECGIQGEIMMCYKKFNKLCYTALISSSESGKFKVIEDIPASQIKYRKESQVKSPAFL